MKYLFPQLILIFALSAFGYNHTSLNDWLSVDGFSIEDASVFASNNNAVALPFNGKIAFTSSRTGGYKIFTMNPDGTNQTKISNNTEEDFSGEWSPDGNKIVFYKHFVNNNEIYTMNANGSNQIRLTNNTAFDESPSWSPDGIKIVFSSDRNGFGEIYVMNANGTNQTRLTNSVEGSVDYSPSYSPDGSRIAFASNRSGNWEIYVMNADGSNIVNITNNPSFDYTPQWSPGGSRIAFSSNRSGNDEIWVMGSSGSNPVNLTNNTASDLYPAWSPDETKLAFTSFRDNNSEIYVMNASGSNQTRLTTTNSDLDIYPTWQPISQNCTYSLSPTSASIRASGETGTVNVTTQAGCSWSALSNVPWIITFANGNNTESGSVTFSVAANTGPARTGTITIAGQIFVVNQANGCTYAVPSETLQFPTQGGNGTFAVTTSNGCAWTATTTASWITITSATGIGNDAVSFTVAAFASSGGSRTGTINVGGQSFTIEQDGELVPPPRTAPFDFDRDGKSDFSIYRPSVGEWWYLRSSDGGNAAAQFGTASDKIVPADYTGDRRTDFAFYRKGEWFILRSEDFSYYAFPFGLESDIPVPADYDGDGKADAAVFRPSTSVWYILKSTGGTIIEQFGTRENVPVDQFAANGDVPIPADYNGDGKTDLAVYNSSTNNWRIRTSNSETAIAIFRANTYKAVPADYTGDGKADIALYDFVTNDWFVIKSENQSSITVKFGTSGDIPVPADYDGDGKTDLAIYRPSTSDWWYAASSANGQQRARRFGISTDIPVPSAYVPQ